MTFKRWVQSIVLLSAMLSGGGALAESASAEMRYFRASSAASCNVYMNYSFYNPNFSLKVRNPSALSQSESDFVVTFNRQFQAMAQRAGEACRAPASGAAGLDAGSARNIYSKCLKQDERFGISEGGWVGGKLPAPSNCISPKLAAPGVVKIISGDLPAPKMTLEQWIAAAEKPK